MFLSFDKGENLFREHQINTLKMFSLLTLIIETLLERQYATLFLYHFTIYLRGKEYLCRR